MFQGMRKHLVKNGINIIYAYNIIPKRVLDHRVFCLGGLAWKLLLQSMRRFCMLYIVKVYFDDIWYANKDLLVCVPFRLDQIFSQNMFINGLALHVLYVYID